VRFLHDWSHPKESLRKAYESLQDHFPQKVLSVPIEDPDAEWAVSAKRLKESVKTDPDQVP